MSETEKIQIRKRYICRPLVVAELRKMCDESGKSPWDVIYSCFLDKMNERIAHRAAIETGISGMVDINALKTEVNRVIERHQWGMGKK